MLVYVAVFLCELIAYNESPRILDKPAKVLLLIPLILLLNAVKINYRHIIWAFIVSSSLLLTVASYDVFFLHKARAGSQINAIQFGAIAIAISATALALTSKLTTKVTYGKMHTVILLCIASSGLFAGILSQSKGSIIAVPIVIVFICLLYIGNLNIGRSKAFCIVGAVLLIASTLIYHSPAKDRFARSITNTIAFAEGSKTKNSSGIRLGLWGLSLEAGSLSPVFGVGYTKFVEYKTQQIDLGRYGQELHRYDNSHNAYANAFARRGVIGLLAVIIFLGFPIYIGLQIWRQKQKELAPFAVALSSFGCVFFIANITQEVIFLNTGIIMYTGLLVILTSMLAERIKACESDPTEEQLSSNQ